MLKKTTTIHFTTGDTWGTSSVIRKNLIPINALLLSVWVCCSTASLYTLFLVILMLVIQY